MLTSEKVDAVLPALLAATTAIGHGIAKAKQGHGYKYAELASLLDLACPHLEAQGLLVVASQPAPDMVVTRCYHAATGQYVEVSASTSADGERERKGGPQGAQAAGSAYTYGRRYGLMALLGIAGEDDDGRATRPDSRSTAAPAEDRKPGATVAFTAEEVAYAIAQGWKDPAGWPAASQARYRADIDSGKVKVTA